MDYKITWLTLRIVPKINVNREEFLRGILEVLGLYTCRNKFVNVRGNKHYFSEAVYNGIRIKLPFYETMLQQGFVLEISKKGMEFLTGFNEFGAAYLYILLLDTFEASVIRMDIETDYLPPHILKKIPSEYLKSNATVYIGSVKSDFHCRYSKNKATYISRNRQADFISDELLCNNYYGFGVSFSGFLHDWKPRETTIYDIVIEKEPCPHSATKNKGRKEKQ